MHALMTTLMLLLWAAIDYHAAKYLADTNDGFYVNPALYAIGAIILGGIFPLIYLAIKYILWNYAKKH